MNKLLGLLLVGLVAAACAGPGEPPATQPAAPPSATVPAPSATPGTAAPPSASPAHTLVITLAKGRVEPNGERVNLNRGDTVRLQISSDRDDEIHVHGVDRTVQVKAGEPVSADFVVEQTGRYEIESHHPELLIAVLQVR